MLVCDNLRAHHFDVFPTTRPNQLPCPELLLSKPNMLPNGFPEYVAKLLLGMLVHAFSVH